MAALKRSLAQESGETTPKRTRKAAGDRRQRNLLLPMAGNRKDDTQRKRAVAAEPGTKRRKKA